MQPQIIVIVNIPFLKQILNRVVTKFWVACSLLLHKLIKNCYFVDEFYQKEAISHVASREIKHTRAVQVVQVTALNDSLAKFTVWCNYYWWRLVDAVYPKYAIFMICFVQIMQDCSLLPVYARFGTVSLYHYIHRLAMALYFPSPCNHIASGWSIYKKQLRWICKKKSFWVEKNIASNNKEFEEEKTQVK